MIGNPASATVWAVTYSFKKPPRKSKMPKSVKKEDETVSNQVVITTADPTGADIYHVACRIVLGEIPHDGHDFRILQSQKVADVMGLALVSTWEKLDGKAPENSGIIIDDEFDEVDGDEGGSIPPAANLN